MFNTVLLSYIWSALLQPDSAKIVSHRPSEDSTQSRNLHEHENPQRQEKGKEFKLCVYAVLNNINNTPLCSACTNCVIWLTIKFTLTFISWNEIKLSQKQCFRICLPSCLTKPETGQSNKFS